MEKGEGYSSNRCLKHIELIQANKESIEKISVSQKEDKSDIKEIKEELKALGNGKFRSMVMEQNKQLLKEVLNRDDKEREFKIQKWKVIAGVLGGGVGLKLIEYFIMITSKTP